MSAKAKSAKLFENYFHFKGISFWISIFPADVIKSRVQIDPNSAIAKVSFLKALQMVVKTEGIIF